MKKTLILMLVLSCFIAVAGCKKDKGSSGSETGSSADAGSGDVVGVDGWGLDPALANVEIRSGEAIKNASWTYNFDTTYSGITLKKGHVAIMKSDGSTSQIQYAGYDLFCLTGKSMTKDGVLRSTKMVRYGNLPISSPPFSWKGNTGTQVVPPDSEVYYKIFTEGSDTVVYMSLTANPGPGNHLTRCIIKKLP